MNNDEDDLEDGGNEIVEKHNPDSEPLPDLPMYHPAVREVEVLCYVIVSGLEQFLEHSTYKDSETEYLLKESKELEHTPHERHILRIALVGDAGQGKSSLLNSMLGYANLAIQVSYRSLLHISVLANFNRLPTETPLPTSLSNMPRQPLAKRRSSKPRLSSTRVKRVATSS